jgi:hypothetical protein
LFVSGRVFVGSSEPVFVSLALSDAVPLATGAGVGEHDASNTVNVNIIKKLFIIALIEKIN